MSIVLALVTALLFACGSWLLMQRRLTRIIIGIGLLGHGANLLLITSGGPGGRPPLIGSRRRTAGFPPAMYSRLIAAPAVSPPTNPPPGWLCPANRK